MEKKKKRIVNVNKVVFNMRMMDLIKLRIVVDAYSNNQRIKSNTDKQNFNTKSKSNIKKVLKYERHK